MPICIFGANIYFRFILSWYLFTSTLSNSKIYCQDKMLQERNNQPNPSFLNFLPKLRRTDVLNDIIYQEMVTMNTERQSEKRHYWQRGHTDSLSPEKCGRHCFSMCCLVSLAEGISDSISIP